MSITILFLMLAAPGLLLAQQTERDPESLERSMPAELRHERLQHEMRQHERLLPDGQRQESQWQDTDSLRLFLDDKIEKSHEKSAGVRFTVDSDALINGLTVGRGGGQWEHRCWSFSR